MHACRSTLEDPTAKKRYPVNNYPILFMATGAGASPDVLALLKGAKRRAPSFDWAKGEADLYEAARDEIARVAKKYKKVTFSGFAFDCDPGNGFVGTKLNEASNVIDSEWGPVGSYSHVAGGFEQDKRVVAFLDEVKESSTACKRFMDVVTRVAVRLEQTDAFAPLSRTESFELWVADHDEPATMSIARLRRVRKQVGGAAPKAATRKAAPPAKKALAAKAPAGKAAAGKASPAKGAVRLEFRQGGSSKFWEISVDGPRHTVRFGRIGAAGQTASKAFPSTEAARRDADKLIAQKRKKGYA